MNRLTVTAKSFVAKSTLVVFDYKSNKNGVVETRSLVVAESTPTHLAGQDLFRGGEYRKFLRSNIVGDVVIWGMLEPLPGTE